VLDFAWYGLAWFEERRSFCAIVGLILERYRLTGSYWKSFADLQRIVAPVASELLFLSTKGEVGEHVSHAGGS
jgi:hypothetical protein